MFDRRLRACTRWGATAGRARDEHHPAARVSSACAKASACACKWGGLVTKRAKRSRGWGSCPASTPSPSLPAQAVAKFFEPGTEAGREVLFGCYLQYHLHLQLAAASCYAADVGVALKGDLPIGVDPCSVDTWLYPHLFHLGTGTGSPPDWFNRNGQNWGFPTYNWEEMAAEGYTWWRRRLAHLSLYFQVHFPHPWSGSGTRAVHDGCLGVGFKQGGVLGK